jgi:signal transduction histidine kinase/HPt (histidine-containing phosphotransfer) domain-containing protein
MSPAPQVAHARADDVAHARSPRARPSTVLVVDDRADNRDLLAVVLRSAAYRVVEAASGAEALAIARSTHPDLIITDLLMPAMDGYEFARLLRADPGLAETRIVFHTGIFIEEEVRRLAAACGVEHFLVKPCEAQDILDVVALALAAEPSPPGVAVPGASTVDDDHVQALRDRLIAKVEELEHAIRREELVNEQLRSVQRETTRSLTLLETLLASAPVGLCLIDRELRVRHINDLLAVSSPIAIGDQIGRAVADVLPSLWAHIEPHYTHVVESRRAVLNQNVAGASHEDPRQQLSWQASYYPVLLEDEVIGLGVVVVDVTALRRAEAEAAGARDLALEASRMKSSFLANVSHEIRTPLGGVVGMSHLLQYSSLDNQQREYARLLQHSAETLVTVVNDILDFSKIEAGALRLERIDFDLVAAVEDGCDLLAGQAQHKGVRLTIDLDPELPEIVNGDPVRVQQVLGNLLSNAIKFTGAGEIHVTARTIATDGAATWVRFEVSDSGIGLEPEQLERVFQRFTQADDSTTRRFGGTGLGLAIVQQLVQMMDGEVGVESVFGEGSRFWFTLPLGNELQAHGDETAYPELTGSRLLVVDEDEETRRLITALGRGWQMQVTTVDNATAALACLREAAATEPFHCVAIDLQISDGIELVADILRDARFTTPAIMTLTSTYEQRQRSRDAGIHVFTTKPVRRARLGVALTETLRNRRRRVDTPGGSDAGKAMYVNPVILVAEDNAVNQILAASMLSRRGYRTEVVTNGAEALSALSQRPFAAVLMDCQMPEMSGYDATARLRLREPAGRHTPVIAMTAHALHGDREKCLLSGMDDYLSKPLNPDELDRILSRWAPRIPTEQPTPPAAEPPDPLVRNEAAAHDRADPTSESAMDELRDDLGGAQALARVVDVFGRQTPDLLAAMRAAIAAPDAGALARHAHKLRGGCLTLAATHMAGLCDKLERSVAGGSVDGAAELMDGLDRAFQARHAELRAAVAVAEFSP